MQETYDTKTRQLEIRSIRDQNSRRCYFFTNHGTVLCQKNESPDTAPTGILTFQNISSYRIQITIALL